MRIVTPIARCVSELAGLTDLGTRTTFARALSARDGLRERLVWFWADHFTTVARKRIDKAFPSALIEDAIRPHVMGRFSDMLQAVTLHPAMLVYLDQVISVGPNSPAGLRRGRGLNENLARELIELHTLGVGAVYAQDDVRQMAELLTGLVFKPEVGQGFEPNWVEPGSETVLGISYEGEGEEPILRALGDLALRPETARHIARKLAVHFISDTPDEDLVDALNGAFVASGGELAAVYTALVSHPSAWEKPMQKARQPFDFMVSALRALALGHAMCCTFVTARFTA